MIKSYETYTKYATLEFDSSSLKEKHET